MNFETILVSEDAPIVTITLHRPDKLNALNAQMISELRTAFEILDHSELLRCVIIVGSGAKAFAAGADIAELRSCDSANGRAFAENGQAVFTTIEQFRVPVIAAVNGFALGGGCELAMSCHFRYASETAKFGQPEVKLGIIPGYGGTQRLSRHCGQAVATELICTGDIIGADRALTIGLVNKVLPVDELMEACMKSAQQISSMAALAVEASLRCIRGSDQAFNQGMSLEATEFGSLCDTNDFREGTLAFLEKRAATFSGS